jgi:hypothetical protein
MQEPTSRSTSPSSATYRPHEHPRRDQTQRLRRQPPTLLTSLIALAVGHHSPIQPNSRRTPLRANRSRPGKEIPRPAQNRTLPLTVSRCLTHVLAGTRPGSRWLCEADITEAGAASGYTRRRRRQVPAASPGRMPPALPWCRSRVHRAASRAGLRGCRTQGRHTR